MSVHVLLNLLNELGKRDKLRGLRKDYSNNIRSQEYGMIPVQVWSSLIRVNSVCFHERSGLRCT